MGKWWDQFIMRITDAWLTMPSLVFAILLSSVRGPGLWNIVIILAAVFWSRYARSRAVKCCTLFGADFVKLAEINGVRKLRIIFRHILPNVINTVMVVFSLQVGVAVIIEARSASWASAFPRTIVGTHDGPGTWSMARKVVSSFRVSASRCSCSRPTCSDWLRVRLDPQLRNR